MADAFSIYLRRQLARLSISDATHSSFFSRKRASYKSMKSVADLNNCCTAFSQESQIVGWLFHRSRSLLTPDKKPSPLSGENFNWTYEHSSVDVAGSAPATHWTNHPPLPSIVYGHRFLTAFNPDSHFMSLFHGWRHAIVVEKGRMSAIRPGTSPAADARVWFGTAIRPLNPWQMAWWMQLLSHKRSLSTREWH